MSEPESKNCQSCGHPAPHHVIGIGCTEITGWEGGSVIKAEGSQSVFDFEHSELPGTPIVCPCKESETK